MRYIKSFQNDAAIQAAVDDKSLGKPYVALNNATGKIDWNGKSDLTSYLTFDILSDGIIKFSASDSRAKKTIQYRINAGEWATITSNTGENAPSFEVSTGDVIQFKGNNSTYGSGDSRYSGFRGSTCEFNARGNIMSLITGDDFKNNTTLTSGSTFLCMFRETNIIDASRLILPALILRNNCHYGMFYGCTSLTTAPAIHATTLAQSSCSNMFRGCTNLNYIKCLATDISASFCLSLWVAGVSTTGTFVKKAGVTWPTGDNGIPSGWTVIEE